jgi:hypothetical protein
VATAALAVSVAAQQPATGNQQTQGTKTMQGMEGMQEGQHGKMHGMMQDCHKDMQTVMQSNEQAKKEVEAAKQSNDPTKMRTALDTAEKALAKVNDHMNKCMGMMQDMHGMKTGQPNASNPNPPQN